MDGFDYVEDEQWVYKDQEELLSEITEMIEMKKIQCSHYVCAANGYCPFGHIWTLRYFSIFRRQREIGTYIALGMDHAHRWLAFFTVEGTVYSIVGVVLGALYGFPLFLFLSTKGYSTTHGL